jgi:hypothetical protein
MGNRLAGLAVLVGGVLVALEYLFWTGNGLAPDRISAQPNTPGGQLVLLVIGGGTLLLTLGLPTLMQRQGRRLGQMGVVGGWLLVFGFLLWALAALAGTSLVELPLWVGLADQVLVVVGSVLFGLASHAAGVLPRRAALGVAVCGLVGLLPSALPDLLFFLVGVDLNPGEAVREIGYLALLLFGVAWAGLGYAVWRRT